eukprot:CAMPEP_0119552772 /NCGR_PEP_ID=MMETSP1352-20130426/5690_1 /TAXON_ID=265584 /ORGANISM="Stauroneis constricta, Strain CCMP1120" /LENGTH=202 /DNA_ID=CAMNT_0007599067 /DNA_START=146 /DNA_END=751 /DNA_ORIENTATION=+
MMNTGASATDPSATTLSTTPAMESNMVDKFGHHHDGNPANNNSNVDDDDMEACMVSATSRSSSQNNGLPRSTGGYGMEDEDEEGHDANAVAMASSGGVARPHGFFGNRSSKKLVAIGALIVILAIVISVSVGLSGNNNDGDDDSNVDGGSTLKKDGDTDTAATAAATTTQSTSPAENPGSDRISDEQRRRNFDEIVSLVLPT